MDQVLNVSITLSKHEESLRVVLANGVEAMERNYEPVAAGAYPGFWRMKRLGVFLLPLDGMLVHRRSLSRNLLGFLNNSPVPIYTPGWRGTVRVECLAH